MAVISVNKACFSYDGKTPIFTDLSFALSSAEIMCILGPNGIGKTTLLKGMMNMHPLTSGSVTLDGVELKKIKPKTLAKAISFIPQTYKLAFPYKVIDLVLMGRTPHLNSMNRPSREDYEKAAEALEQLGISGLMYRPCNALSGGQLQMVMLARATAQQAQFILLDEPTSHLDYGKQMETLDLVSLLKSRGIGVLMTTHNPDHAFLVADKVAIMDGGGFASVGAPCDTVTEETLRQIYKIPVRIVPLGGDINRRVCVPLQRKSINSAER